MTNGTMNSGVGRTKAVDLCRAVQGSEFGRSLHL